LQLSISPLSVKHQPKKFHCGEASLDHDIRQYASQGNKRRVSRAFIINYDVLLCPVAATTAKKHGTTYDNLEEFSYSVTCNLTGWPSVVVCCGTAENGLPIGVQIISRQWQDHMAIAVAKKIQSIYGVYPMAEPGEV
jgi:amidase